MSRGLARLSAFAILGLCAALIGVDSRAGCPAEAATVNISVANDKITVPEDQKEVTIYLDEGKGKGKSKVCWVVRDLDEGYLLLLYRKSTTNGTGYFPDLKKKFKGRKDKPLQDRLGVPKKKGNWHYGIKLKKNGSVVDKLDPTIIILADPGAGGG